MRAVCVCLLFILLFLMFGESGKHLFLLVICFIYMSYALYRYSTRKEDEFKLDRKSYLEFNKKIDKFLEEIINAKDIHKGGGGN